MPRRPPSPFRATPRGGLSLGAVAALGALAAATTVSAAPVSTATAIVVGRSPGSQDLLVDSHTGSASSLGGGASAFSTFNSSPGPADHPQTIMEAFVDGRAGSVGIFANAFVGSTNVRDKTQASSLASYAGVDQLALSSTEGAGRLVTLHKTLSLDTRDSFVFGGVTEGRGDPNGDFTGTLSAKLQISGTGIGAGKFGDDVFDHTVVSFGRGDTVNDHRTPATTVDFTYTFTLGEAQDLFLNVLLTSALELDDRDGSFYGSEYVRKNYDLFWMDGGTLTDAATGASVCGVTGQAASGFNYLRGITFDACVPAGPGPGGGAAVPEPATWALMIAGFGMAGAGLRRRRAVTAG